MFIENILVGWEKEEKVEDMKGVISVREFFRDGFMGLIFYSKKRDFNFIRIGLEEWF